MSDYFFISISAVLAEGMDLRSSGLLIRQVHGSLQHATGSESSYNKGPGGLCMWHSWGIYCS